MMLNLSDYEWKEFLLKDLFDIRATSSGIDRNKLTGKLGLTPYITRTDLNNGFDSFIGEQPKYNLDSGNVITVGLDTQTAFYQPVEFYTGQNIQVLESEYINRYTALFIIPRLKDLMKKFNWGGNGATLTRLKRSKMMLPVDENGNPNWIFMEEYMQIYEKRMINRYEKYLNKLKIATKQTIPEPKQWLEFKIGDLFGLVQGKSKGLNHLQEASKGVNYLGATNQNNGVLTSVLPIDKQIQKGNAIAFIRNGEGSMGYAVYKAEDFIATSDITVGYNENLNRYVGQYIVSVANKVRGKYNFGYKRSGARLAKETLLLPATENGEPDWVYMEAYERERERVNASHKELAQKVAWREYYIKDIFDFIQRGKRLKSADHTKGKMPYVSSSATNNAVDDFVNNTEKVRVFNDCLTLANSGNVGSCFYQPFDFIASDHITGIKKNGLNKYVYLFMSSIISRLSEKYSFNREINDVRIMKEKILLPAQPDGEPDYGFMENYAKNLEEKQLSRYMTYLRTVKSNYFIARIRQYNQNANEL